MNSHPPTHEAKSLFGADKKLLFVLLCVFSILLLYVKISFLENETAAFEFLQDQPQGTVLRMISALQLFSIPLIYLWKFTVIAFVIWVGCFLFGYRVTYSQCWTVVLVSEYIFLIPEILKIVWFLTVNTDPTIYEIRAFYPLSLMHFFDYNEMDKRWAYPLRALNAFEILYWVALATGIHYFAQKDRRIVWFIVCASYILIFLLWLAFYIIVYK